MFTRLVTTGRSFSVYLLVFFREQSCLSCWMDSSYPRGPRESNSIACFTLFSLCTAAPPLRIFFEGRATIHRLTLLSDFDSNVSKMLIIERTLWLVAWHLLFGLCIHGHGVSLPFAGFLFRIENGRYLFTFYEMSLTWRRHSRKIWLKPKMQVTVNAFRSAPGAFKFSHPKTVHLECTNTSLFFSFLLSRKLTCCDYSVSIASFHC